MNRHNLKTNNELASAIYLQMPLPMNLADLRAFCLSLPGVTEDIKWEDHLCFNVGGKMFLITNPEKFPVTASFKTTEENFEKLTSVKGIIPAPYLARYRWVYVADLEQFSAKQWKEHIVTSYQMVRDKLPAKVKKSILAF